MTCAIFTASVHLHLMMMMSKITWNLNKEKFDQLQRWIHGTFYCPQNSCFLSIIQSFLHACGCRKVGRREKICGSVSFSIFFSLSFFHKDVSLHQLRDFVWTGGKQDGENSSGENTQNSEVNKSTAVQAEWSRCDYSRDIILLSQEIIWHGTCSTYAIMAYLSGAFGQSSAAG